MKDLLKPEIGVFVFRISFGVVLLAHSLYLKMMVFGLAGTAGYFESIGLPGFLAYVVFGIETVAGIALILGYKTSQALCRTYHSSATGCNLGACSQRLVI